MSCSARPPRADAIEAKPGLWLPHRLGRPLRPTEARGPANGDLEPELAGVPAAFVTDTLDRLGPRLLESVCECQPAPGTSQPDEWWRPSTVGPNHRPSGGPPHPRADLLRPSHLLDVSFIDTNLNHSNLSPSSSCAPQPSYLVPAHGFVWAAKCAALSRLGKGPLGPTTTFAAQACAPAEAFPISVVQLRLPSARAWPFIHSWIYHGKPDQLGQHLMTFDALEPPSPLPSPTLRAASGAVGPLASSPYGSLDADLLELSGDAAAYGVRSPTAELARHGPPGPHEDAFAPSRAAVLDRAALVNSIWRSMVALGIEDDELWGHMDGVWTALVDMLEPAP